jgi:hypothetical protein
VKAERNLKLSIMEFEISEKRGKNQGKQAKTNNQ